MENKVLNIKKLKITCKNCKTEVITQIGRSIYSCPDCGASFNVNRENDYFIAFKDVLNKFKENVNAEFSIICEDG